MVRKGKKKSGLAAAVEAAEQEELTNGLKSMSVEESQKDKEKDKKRKGKEKEQVEKVVADRDFVGNAEETVVEETVESTEIAAGEF